VLRLQNNPWDVQMLRISQRLVDPGLHHLGGDPQMAQVPPILVIVHPRKSVSRVNSWLRRFTPDTLLIEPVAADLPRRRPSWVQNLELLMLAEVLADVGDLSVALEGVHLVQRLLQELPHSVLVHLQELLVDRPILQNLVQVHLWRLLQI